MKLLKKVTITFLILVMLLFSFAACDSSKAEEKPWLKSSRTNSQAGTSSQAVGESSEGSEGTLTSEPTPDSATPSPVPEKGEVSEEDKQQSIYWNGIGTSFYHQFIPNTHAVEAWMKAIELNPKNISPYLHIVNVAFGPDDADYNELTIPEYAENMKRLCKSFLSSGLESVTLSDEEEIATLSVDQMANTLTVTRTSKMGKEIVRTLSFAENGTVVKYACEETQEDTSSNQTWLGMQQVYSFEYNEKDQLVSVAAKSDNRYSRNLYEDSYSYQYNEIGQLIKASEHCEEYRENDESEHEKTDEYTYEYTYEYNADGTLARESHPTTTEDGISTEYETLYTYDAQERLIQVASGYINAEKNWARSYNYEDNGNLVEIEQAGSDYSDQNITCTYTFDDRGWICGANQGNGEETILLDDYGNREIDEENIYNADGNPTHAWGYDFEYKFAE